jgi:hypothetical protein
MQPETPLSPLSPERPSAQNGPSIEREPKLISPEVGVELGAERYEHKSETNAIVADVSLTTIPTPVIATPVVANATTIVDSPLTANDDDDLIEKKWVEAAKEIVDKTKNNPYQQDESVNKLKVDYIDKRFGRKLGVAK